MNLFCGSFTLLETRKITKLGGGTKNKTLETSKKGKIDLCSHRGHPDLKGKKLEKPGSVCQIKDPEINAQNVTEPELVITKNSWEYVFKKVKELVQIKVNYLI